MSHGGLRAAATAAGAAATASKAPSAAAMAKRIMLHWWEGGLRVCSYAETKGPSPMRRSASVSLGWAGEVRAGRGLGEGVLEDLLRRPRLRATPDPPLALVTAGVQMAMGVGGTAGAPPHPSAVAPRVRADHGRMRPRPREAHPAVVALAQRQLSTPLGSPLPGEQTLARARGGRIRAWF